MKQIFSVIFTLMALTIIAQDIDDPGVMAADAAFMGRGRYYQSISPIIDQMHDWQVWETNYDSAAKFQLVKKIKGERLTNFIYEKSIDSDGNPVGDTIEFYQGNLHFLDYDNDGFEDLIFEQQLSIYRGHKIKFYRGNGEHYNLAYNFTGMLVAMSREEGSGALRFTLYDYPCCDGYVHVLKSYFPMMINGTVNYLLSRVDKYVQSNLKRLKNLPKSFMEEKSFKTKLSTVVLYRDVRPIYQKFEPEVGYQRKYKNFHPFAVLPGNTEGVILNETLGQTRTGKDSLVFVRFVGVLDQKNSIRHLVKTSLNVDEQNEDTFQRYYYGWIDKKDLLIELETNTKN